MTSEKGYRYYDLIMVAFVSVLLCCNLIGVSKVCTIGGITFGGGILFFPISYLFGDILTEVYGYKRSRKVIWAGFGAMVFASLVSWVVIHLPPAAGWKHQSEIETVFSQTPRIVLASLLAYFAGELSNSYVLARLKVITAGKWLWFRVIGSTMIGEGVDSLIFYPLAFWNEWSLELLLEVMATNYVLKILWEVIMTPATYRIVSFLKKAENEDFFDYDTNFSPFSLST